jgi:hypothetical protein
MRKTILGVAVLILTVALLVGGYGVRELYFPCVSVFGPGPLTEDALYGYKPPYWDKETLIQELRDHKIPYRIEDEKVLIPECGGIWLGRQWW